MDKKLKVSKDLEKLVSPCLRRTKSSSWLAEERYVYTMEMKCCNSTNSIVDERIDPLCLYSKFDS